MNTQQLKDLFVEWQSAKVDSHYPTITFEESDMLEASFSALTDHLEAAERERDELRAIAEKKSKLAGSNAARAQKAEAEIARRDAAAGEPFAYIDSAHLNEFGWGYVFKHSSPMRMACESPVYTTAAPAVFPPKYADELTARAELIEAYSKTQCEIAQELGCDSHNESTLKAICEIKDLGAQPQKVVELPDHKFRECVNGLLEEAIAYAGTQQLRARLSSRLSNFVKPQHATGVKWEVKK